MICLLLHNTSKLLHRTSNLLHSTSNVLHIKHIASAYHFVSILTSEMIESKNIPVITIDGSQSKANITSSIQNIISQIISK